MPLRDILIITAVIAAVPLAFVRPWFGILAWTWLGLMNPHKMTWYAQHLPLAQAVAISTLAALLLAPDRKRVPWTREMVILALFAVDVTITTITAWYPEVSWAQWDKVSKILLFTFITPMLIYGQYRTRWLLLVIVFSLGFFGFKGGLFSILTGGHHRVLGPESSFIADNNSLGLALCMVLPLALISARQEHHKYIKWALYSIFYFSIVAILFTYSRGAFLGLIALMLAIFWRYKGRIFVIGLLAAVVVFAAKDFIPSEWYDRQESTLHYKEDNSAMQRIQAWSVAINIAKARPLLGAGMSFDFAGDSATWLSYASFLGDWDNKARAAHSIYLQVLGGLGVPGFSLFILLLFFTFFRLRSLARFENHPELSWIGVYARALQYSLIPYMVSGAFLSLAYFDLFYMVVALSAILSRDASAQTANEVSVVRDKAKPLLSGDNEDDRSIDTVRGW
ncbi:putative O-glycosylation ligase, exosortase A system-associated [Nitrococcus mobilis]|uniref:O-antigen polymerase n=1 Tax=Nitrococcus mobilis Nb-231 TaxID=314278 RepID=A4BT73_9GAMM|nr:putative O-glycosylation ligase, exosortase A system-associated [Nitrococcus mobilis]EAR21141.1 O-antigen polymerase [Nitrococcus mobilis Nb-231]